MISLLCLAAASLVGNISLPNTLQSNEAKLPIVEFMNQNFNLFVNKYNESDVLKGRCPSLKEAYDILSIPLIGIVYEEHDMIEANNKGMPIYMNKKENIYRCFDRIVKRLEGQEIPFQKNKRKPLLERLFR